MLNDPDEVVIDFAESRVVDLSAIEALNKLTERYLKAGKTLHLRHLSADCHKLLKNAEKIVEVNYWADPTYKLVADLDEPEPKEVDDVVHGAVPIATVAGAIKN